VKIPFDPVTKNYRIPTGQCFSSLDTVINFLETNPDLLSEADGFIIELIAPVQIPIAESVVNVGRDRMLNKSKPTYEDLGIFSQASFISQSVDMRLRTY
jgi:hypothetical protein